MGNIHWRVTRRRGRLDLRFCIRADDGTFFEYFPMRRAYLDSGGTSQHLSALLPMIVIS